MPLHCKHTPRRDPPGVARGAFARGGGLGARGWTVGARAVVFALFIGGCRRDAPDHAPADAASTAAASAPGPEAIAEAARTRPDEDVRVLVAPRPVGARALLVLARGARGTSPTLEAVFAEGARVSDRVELPTSGLLAPADGGAPAEVDESEKDVDGDGSPEIVLDVRYATEPACGDAGPSPRAHVAQLFVLEADPVLRVAAAVQTRYEPRSSRVEARRTSATWEGAPPALVVTGEECVRGDDAGPCRAVRERYPFDPATRSWLVGLPPARALPPPCD